MFVFSSRNVPGAQLSQALEGKCRVLKMDSDEEEDMAGTLNVSYFSTIAVVCRCVGDEDEDGAHVAVSASLLWRSDQCGGRHGTSRFMSSPALGVAG